MKRKKKFNFQNFAVQSLMMIGGAFAGNQLTTMLEKQDFMNGFVDYSAAATMLAGGAVAYFSPDGIRPLAQGAVIAGGLELVEKFVSGQIANGGSGDSGSSGGSDANAQAAVTSSGKPTLGYTQEVQPPGTAVVREGNLAFN